MDDEFLEFEKQIKSRIMDLARARQEEDALKREHEQALKDVKAATGHANRLEEEVRHNTMNWFLQTGNKDLMPMFVEIVMAKRERVSTQATLDYALANFKTDYLEINPEKLALALQVLIEHAPDCLQITENKLAKEKPRPDWVVSETRSEPTVYIHKLGELLIQEEVTKERGAIYF